MRTLLVCATLVVAITGSRVHAQTPAAGLRAARAMARGDTVTAADIVADSGAAGDPRALIGLVARRVIREGELLRAPAIGVPIVVYAGSPVSVMVTSGGVSVTREGVALHDAGLGEPVRVRLNTRATVVAVVRDSSTVVIS